MDMKDTTVQFIIDDDFQMCHICDIKQETNNLEEHFLQHGITNENQDTKDFVKDAKTALAILCV